nr:hypothetical protein [Moraxella osloensis]
MANLKNKLSQNDTAWEILFDRHSILDNVQKKGFFEISANLIKTVREPRLMTKFDNQSNLPKIFSKNHLSILPITRGSYIIGAFETFHNFNTAADSVPIIPLDFPRPLESLNYHDISSEATAINCAYVSTILSHFSCEENLLPTVSGRMSSSIFNFNIREKRSATALNIQVNNSQLEIDGGYEGDNSLILIEAKNYISDDFLIRQLYYPYRLWQSKIRKRVRPVFLTYTNGIFDLREYQFSSINDYNSLVLIDHKRYTIQDSSITFNMELLQKILISEILNYPEPPGIPFPQANSFPRVINLCELIHERGSLSKEDITMNYDFDSRQSDYYANAACYLGLISRHEDMKYYLTLLGTQVFNQSLGLRQIEFAKLILRGTVFKQVLQEWLKTGYQPDTARIVEIIKNSINSIGSDDTFKRRASTVRSWTKWIIDELEA